MNLLNGTGLELSDADSESGVLPSLQVHVTYTLLFSEVFCVKAAAVELQTETADAANVTLTVNETVCREYYNLSCEVVPGRTALRITGNQSMATYQKVIAVPLNTTMTYHLCKGFTASEI